MTTVFDYSDYKDLIRGKIASTQESWGLISKMAKAAGCQRSYLSKVLSGSIHLTPDHAYGLCDFWGFTQTQSDYFLLLLEKDRAASKKYRTHIEHRIAVIKRENENLAKRLQRPRVEAGEKELTYYSAWHWTALHILSSIPAFQTIKAMSSRLQLPEELVRHSLEKMQEHGLVRQEKGHWKFSSTEFHIPRESLLVGLHHNNWRQRAVLNAQQLDHESVHYTVVQSMSRQTFEKIRQNMLQFIDEAAKIAGPSKEEELVCLTCDVFKV